MPLNPTMPSKISGENPGLPQFQILISLSWDKAPASKPQPVRNNSILPVFRMGSEPSSTFQGWSDLVPSLLHL